ncbi:chromate transporter [Inhella inkyongensis]|uniref:Chromate transporter n=1 Tax=Inhella inkyongensis TaxID=392593 RepID=A0A840S9I5_9BURK|nr:chromate transporter [Inhella inkyongensis]MBB5206282.1 chromate transporter [Inhella inkyongensis]
MGSPSQHQPTPRSPWQLAWVCNRMALQGFGGIVAVAQHEVVERERWLKPSEFVELMGSAQVLPGPNVINLMLMLGQRYFGWRGVVAVLGGMLLLPGLLVIALAASVQSSLHLPWVQGALRGMGLVAAGLTFAAGLKMLSAVRQTPLGATALWALSLLTLVLSLLARWPLWGVVLCVSSLGVTLAWRRGQKAP